MVRLTRIYTRTGDQGLTSLVGGERVHKNDVRIEAYGTVDELNAVLGVARELGRRFVEDGDTRRWLDDQLQQIQQKLFDLGASLATRSESRYPGQPAPCEDDVSSLEQHIDTMNAELEPLNSFVLPGGGPVAAQLHVARTVCRRAERRTLTLAQQDAVEPVDLKYLNRLSDYLFVASRWIARRCGQAEPLWTPGQPKA